MQRMRKDVSSMPTKDFSSAQENMIADYLGWSVVSGSGAAACHPGDVISDDWLGECKTHVKPEQKIFFSKSVWKKICDEAMIKRRYPVLFTDDGSQRSNKTWCLFSHRQVNRDECTTYSDSTFVNRTNISFGHLTMILNYENININPDKPAVFLFRWGEDTVAVCPLSTFRELFGEE